MELRDSNLRINLQSLFHECVLFAECLSVTYMPADPRQVNRLTFIVTYFSSDYMQNSPYRFRENLAPFDTRLKKTATDLACRVIPFETQQSSRLIVKLSEPSQS